MLTPNSIARSLVSFACVAAITGCDLRAIPPSCNDYFGPRDRSGFLTDERGIARKKDSKILWYRCPAGKSFISRRCEGSGLRLNWKDAMAYAEEFAVKSGKPWRLPTNNEMKSIQEKDCVSPSVNPTVFPDAEVENYWTSSSSWHHNSLGCSLYLYHGDLFCRQARTTELPFFLVLDKTNQ
tara:strand:- start:271 stop:813 length:543 start_codon:yes stop_codon:yes gene_type:complete